MAKFHGTVGFAIQSEKAPGVWVEEIIEREYDMEETKFRVNYESNDKVNSDVNISNSYSFISDSYANKNFFTIRYIVFMGIKLKAKNIDVRYPRIIVSVGGVYNGM